MARQRFDSSRIELVRPNPWRWPARLGLGLWMAWVALLFFHVETDAPTGAVVAWSGVAATAVGLISLRHLRKDRRRRRGRLVADDEGVHFRNRLIVEREHLFAAHLLGGRLPQVQLLRYTSPAPLEICVASEEAGVQLIRSLGLSIAEGTAQYHLLYRWSHAHGCVVLAMLMLGAVLMMGAAATPVALLALPIPIALPIAFRRLRWRAIIGSDGVLLEKRFSRRFIEYRSIDRVNRLKRLVADGSAWTGVDIRLHGGEAVRLRTACLGNPEGVQGDVMEPVSMELTERLNGLVDTVRSAPRHDAKAKQVRRAGRSDAEWFDHLHRLGTGSATDYRAAPVHADDLWQLADNPGAEPSARVGAAVALASADDPQASKRLRALAASVVAPLLRRALQRAAGARNEQALRRALAGIEDEAERTAQ